MGVDAQTIETYDNSNLIKEDLQYAYDLLSPEETPFQQLLTKKTCTSTLFEWPVLELAAPDGANRVKEGEDAPAVDDATLAVRLSNVTQISDKVAKVSHTSQAVDAAASNVQRLASQVMLKMRELKRDKEVMLMANVAANPAASDTARVTAGLPAYLRSNVKFRAGGANPTLSGTTDGYPDAPATVGTADALFLEDDLNDVIEACWKEGASPSIVMVNSGNKRRMSQVFVGNATRYKDTTDKTVINVMDFYETDFGNVSIVPNRFQPPNDTVAPSSYNVFVLDPEYLAISYLDEVQQKPLAETGHTMSTLIWCEYGLQIENEKAHGVIRDTSNLIS